MKKSLSKQSSRAISRTWALFVIGLSKLNYDSDHFIEVHLKNMVVTYLPQYATQNSPFVRCLDDNFDENVAKFILETISSNFIRCKNRIPNENAREVFT